MSQIHFIVERADTEAGGGLVVRRYFNVPKQNFLETMIQRPVKLNFVETMIQRPEEP